MADILSMQGLTKSYGRKEALKGLTLTVEAGQVFGLLGPNGSGKTTALGISLGAVHADQGTVRWFGQGASGRERRRIGALLEQPCFYPWLSGEANLKVFAAVKGLPAAAVTEPLRTVGLWDARLQAFQTYSLGMKQRLAIAQALLAKPEALVLDEPTNGVDAQGIADTRSLIVDYARKGGTVILASHLLDEVEKVCSHVAILRGGTILKSGPVASLLGSDGWIELAATDLALLEQRVRGLEPAARLERKGSYLEVHGGRLSAEDLNGRLVSEGLVLSHLVRRQSTLEAQYLDLVGPGGQE